MFYTIVMDFTDNNAFADLVPVVTDKVRQSYPVEYCLESVEEYSEGSRVVLL